MQAFVPTKHKAEEWILRSIVPVQDKQRHKWICIHSWQGDRRTFDKTGTNIVRALQKIDNRLFPLFPPSNQKAVEIRPRRIPCGPTKHNPMWYSLRRCHYRRYEQTAQQRRRNRCVSTCPIGDIIPKYPKHYKGDWRKATTGGGPSWRIFRKSYSSVNKVQWLLHLTWMYRLILILI